MMMVDNQADKIALQRERVVAIESYLDIPGKRERLEELREQASAPGLWDDLEAAREVTTQLSRTERDVDRYDTLLAQIEDAKALNELAVEMDDADTGVEVLAAIKHVVLAVDKVEVSTLLSGEYDGGDAIVSIQAGEGGVDAMDFAQMLQRCYQRWAERQGYEVAVFEESWGEEAGLKSTSFEVRGPDAYGYLSSEHGVHRMLRNSPFDSQGRRQTSFAALDVVPVLPEAETDVDVPDEDVRVDVYRSSGPGGQSVNTTDSAVRLTHLPTGLVVSCQNEKSQHQNKAAAMRVLKVKLAELERMKRQDELDGLRGERKNVGFGSQIRSYFMYGNQIAKDHRSNHENGSPSVVLDGGEPLDAFIEAELRRRAGEAQAVD
ncbi:MAG: peptide chain release factor 2 [Myxococcota bacterium]|jgi:peptide chain release factor 2